MHWTDVFISKITDTVKLVGPTINCEGSPLKGNVDAHWRRNPHVQSYTVATDQVGLSLLLQDGKVFQCYDDMWDTIYHSEIGSSKVLLDAGYNLDSLMVRPSCLQLLRVSQQLPSLQGRPSWLFHCATRQHASRAWHPLHEPTQGMSAAGAPKASQVQTGEHRMLLRKVEHRLPVSVARVLPSCLLVTH